MRARATVEIFCDTVDPPTKTAVSPASDSQQSTATPHDPTRLWPRRALLAVVAVLALVTSIAVAEPLTQSEPNPHSDRADSAGAATVYDASHNAFGRPLANLPEALWQPLRQGKQIFSRVWLPPSPGVSGPVRGRTGRGLGPLYVADRCTACHFKDGREARGEEAPLLVRLGVETAGSAGTIRPEPTYGSQLQPFGVEGVAGEGQPEIRWHEHTVRADDGQVFRLRRPEVVLDVLNYGAPAAGTRWSLRMPPTLVGLGLLEVVPEASVVAWADPDDRDGDGISGRPQWLPGELASVPGDAEPGALLGRFGWKAGQGDLERQAAAALHGDLGISSTWEPGVPCPPAPAPCGELASAGAEISDHQLRRLALYLRLLAPPARRGVDAPQVVRGEQLFAELGCASCHRPELPTRADAVPEALADLTLRPYTDLLLHDLGAGLADGLGEHGASGAEWRTPPLWGLGLLSVVGDGTVRLLHDGRARSLEEAIVWHGGEAEVSQRAFLAAPANDRQDLIRFLESL